MAEDTPCKVQNRRNLEEQQKYFRSCQPWRDSADNSLTNRTHQPRTTFFMHSCCTDLFSFIVRVYRNTMTSMHLHGSRLRCIFASHFKHFIFGAPCPTLCLYMTPRTGTLSSLFPEPVFQHSEQPCEVQWPTAAWRLDGDTTFYRLWAQPDCRRQGIMGTSPDTVSSLNSKIYVSDPCLSTSWL